MLKLANNRETIATAMTAILFLGGVGLLAMGIKSYKDEAFLIYLQDLVNSISGGHLHLHHFQTELKQEVNMLQKKI